MLEEVCSAVGPVRLGAGTSVYPHTNSGRLGVWGVLGGNLDSEPGQRGAHVGGARRSVRAATGQRQGSVR